MQKRAALARAAPLDPRIYTIANRVIMLDKRINGIVATGKPQELRDHSPNPWVRQFFNRDAESDAIS
jgi:ABC-type transporter Mla maintaining outer membrane lipid asymmetry ATPase subunit MlaF